MATLAANQHIQSASSIDIVRKSQFNAPEAPPSGNCDGAKFLNIFSANGGRQQEQRQHQALKASYSLGACETTNSSSSGDRLRRSRKRRQHLYQQQQQHHYHEREQRLDCYNCSRNDRALADWSPHHSSTGLGRQQQRQSHKHAGEVQQMSQQQQRQPSTTGFWISAGDGHSPGAAPSIMPLLAAPTGDGQYRMLQPITLLATGDQSSTSGAVFQSVSMSHLNMMPAGTLVSNLNLAGPNLLGLVSGPDQARLMSKSAQSMTKPRGAGGPVEGEGRRAENVSSTSSSSAAAHGEPTTNDEFTPPPPQTRLNQAKQCDDNSHQQLDDANKTD